MSDKIFGGLDFPTEKTVVKRGMKVEGWAFSNNNNEVEIEIYLDGNFIKKIHTGIPRYDVLQSHQNFQDIAYESGFLTKLAMPQKSIYQFHTLEIIAKTNQSSKTIAKVKIKLDTSDPTIILESWPDQGMTIDFKKGGQKTFDQMNQLTKLKPDYHVLDIGCQLGRLALPLSKFLNKNGRYEGIDIIYEAIDWCNKHISPKFPNFNFTLADVYNGWYNPTGKYKSHEYKLPYEDSSFDHVIVISVFTHMLTKDLNHYISEISRVMKKGATAWITFYLLNDETKQLLDLKETHIDFKYDFDGFRSIRNDKPESSVAWEESIVKNVCEKNELEIIKPIQYGGWRYAKDFSRKSGTIAIQDIVIVSKK